jgi:hypothetical protein
VSIGPAQLGGEHPLRRVRERVTARAAVTSTANAGLQTLTGEEPGAAGRTEQRLQSEIRVFLSFIPLAAYTASPDKSQHQ